MNVEEEVCGMNVDEDACGVLLGYGKGLCEDWIKKDISISYNVHVQMRKG